MRIVVERVSEYFTQLLFGFKIFKAICLPVQIVLHQTNCTAKFDFDDYKSNGTHLK